MNSSSPAVPAPLFRLAASRPSARSRRSEPPPAPDAASGAHLGLHVWSSRAGGFWHYRDVGAYRVTAGLPAAAPSALAETHREFAAACDAEGRTPLHFGLTSAAFEFLPPAPRSAWHIGDLPLFDLSRWHREETLPPSVRAQVRRARNHGVSVVHWATPPHDEARAALERARAAWLHARPLPPLVFMTTPFLFEPWPREGVHAAYKGDVLVGFLVTSRALFGDVLRVDAVVRTPDAPNGTAELLVQTAFRDAAHRGLSRATLGLAPLSSKSSARQRGWLAAVSGCARRAGGPLYSFAGLEEFKAKFAPAAWIPLYVVAPGRAFGPRDLLMVARAFTNGSVSRYVARIFGRALRRRAAGAGQRARRAG